MSHYLTRLVGILAAALIPVSAVAQTNVKSSGRGELVHAKALALRQQAVELYDEPHRAVEAARLHLEEAKYRSVRDPEGVEALAMASHLFNYSKRPIQARKAMEQAAHRAMAIGDVRRAAQAFLDAAFIAQKQKNVGEMRRLGRTAMLLSESPQLADEQRESIQRRIVSSPALAQAVK